VGCGAVPGKLTTTILARGLSNLEVMAYLMRLSKAALRLGEGYVEAGKEGGSSQPVSLGRGFLRVLAAEGETMESVL